MRLCRKVVVVDLWDVDHGDLVYLLGGVVRHGVVLHGVGVGEGEGVEVGDHEARKESPLLQMLFFQGEVLLLSGLFRREAMQSEDEDENENEIGIGRNRLMRVLESDDDDRGVDHDDRVL